MQLASDAALKPPSPDRVFEAASVVLPPFCSSSKNPELLASGRKGAGRRMSARLAGACRAAGRFRTELMNTLGANFPQPVARSGGERLNVRDSWAAACRGLE